MKTIAIKPVEQILTDLKNKHMTTVSHMLGWTTEQYCQHQSEEYEDFLGRLFHGFPIEMLSEVRYSPIMSGFWKNEWLHRNESYFLHFAERMLFEGFEVNSDGNLVDVCATDENRSAIYDEYRYIHSARVLINDAQFIAQYNHILELIRNDNR